MEKEEKRRLKGEVLIEERRVRGFRSSKIFFVLFTASKRSIKLMKILCLKKDFIKFTKLKKFLRIIKKTL